MSFLAMDLKGTVEMTTGLWGMMAGAELERA